MTGDGESRALLQTLERENLFVISLDDERQWYRYHHLFAEVLHTHLKNEQSEKLSILHRRASQWYEKNDMLVDAVHHALAARDFEQVAYLAEFAWHAMTVSYQSGIWLNW